MLWLTWFAIAKEVNRRLLRLLRFRGSIKLTTKSTCATLLLRELHAWWCFESRWEANSSECTPLTFLLLTLLREVLLLSTDIQSNFVPTGVDLVHKVLVHADAELRLVLLELLIGLFLGVEMREHLIVQPQLAVLSLLDKIESKPIKREWVLERRIQWDLIFKQYTTVHVGLDLSADE